MCMCMCMLYIFLRGDYDSREKVNDVLNLYMESRMDRTVREVENEFRA